MILFPQSNSNSFVTYEVKNYLIEQEDVTKQTEPFIMKTI